MIHNFFVILHWIEKDDTGNGKMAVIGYRNRLEREVADALRRAEARRVVAAISGGSDSVALLSALVACRKVEVVAAHCNFHLRGDESERDCREVRNLCRRLGVRLEIKDFDTVGYIKANKGISVEMACRELRYSWFSEVVLRNESDRLVTGHNADDNIETLFLNLLRGSGTSGLRGMREDTGKILRPLLGISRKEILEYLEERGLDYVTDSTNLDSDFRRNYLRNEIIPMLRSRWEGFDKALTRTLRLLSAENNLVEETVSESLPSGGEGLHRDVVLHFAAPELLVRRYIEPLSPRSNTPGEIVAAMRADKPDVRRWQLPGGEAELRGGTLRIKVK